MPIKTRLEPQPPDLQPPWRTAARVELQIEARTFAQDVVLPIADELDPQKAEMPRSLIDQMAAKGWFGITIPAEHGGMGLGVFEYCLVSEELCGARRRRRPRSPRGHVGISAGARTVRPSDR